MGKWPFIILFIGLVIMVTGVFISSSCYEFEPQSGYREVDTCKGDINEGALFDFWVYEKDTRHSFAEGIALNFMGVNILVGGIVTLIVLIARPKEAMSLWIVALTNIGLVANVYFYLYQFNYKDDNVGFRVVPSWGWYLLFGGAFVMLLAALLGTYNLQKSPLEEFDEESDEYDDENELG